MPTKRRFRVKTGNLKSSFKFIMPLLRNIVNAEVKHNLEYCYVRFIIGKKMPDKFLPFGEDPRENILCISIKGDDFGTVYFWDREAELVDKVPQAECYYIIGHTFNDFLSGLRECDQQFV